MGTGREHDLLRPHLPQPLSRPASCRLTHVVVRALDNNQVVMIVVTCDRAARQCAHLFASAELGQCPLDPVGGRLAINARVLAKQGATALRLFVGNDDARARTPGRECCRQSGRAGPDHQHIAVHVHLVVLVRIGPARCAAEPGRMTNEKLVALPKALGPHEGLVIETCR